MAKVPKEVSILLLVALVAIISIAVIFLNTGNVAAIEYGNGNVIGQALSAVTGKTCGTAQKAICKQQMNRCATMKGTWTGDCNACNIKCIMP